MLRRFLAACAVMLWLLPTLVRAGDVQATLDRNSVQLGETVTLNVRIGNAGGNLSMPDLSALNQDFDVLGTSQNSSFNIINGGASSELIIGVTLRPRHAGTLQIPSLAVGNNSTAPLQLQVAPGHGPTASANARHDIFVESQVEPAHGYVGQQLSYVVRLYSAVTISAGALEQPQVRGVEVSQLGNDVTYTAERNGTAYEVHERRYALVPQQAGHINIDPAVFQGETVDPNDPNSLFGASAPVTVIAAPMAIDIKPAPADWGNSAWLPARQLTLSLDGWPSNGESVRVGQPLNLTMNLQATGLGYDTLPTLSFPAVDGATVYPDKPATGNRVDGGWIVGRRQQSFAVVPERAGSLTIPATTLKWWNVQTDREETAQIPARTLTVLPAIGAAASTAPTAQAPAVTSSSSTHALATATTHVVPWRWIAIGSLGLWLLSMIAWLLWRRRRLPMSIDATPRATSTRELHQSFLAAARAGDTAAQARSLLAWAHAERTSIQNLGQLAAALGDERQRAAISVLQQRRYANTPTPDDSAMLADAFQRGLAWRVDGVDENPSGLPPLYPFKLR
ncbi:BatD family protein [Rhodanobacter sp. L36]|uniref:BatD family protein n=1 Tax=Rhodanobacter sp. L36 TaxID=1747221 RepID=UPI0020B12A86|nr:BatD family protein [Rhodanobacter sp. L36]